MKSKLGDSTENDKQSEEPNLQIVEVKGFQKKTQKGGKTLKYQKVYPTNKQFVQYCMSLQFRQSQKDIDF